ncbi:MAG: hypothetical protein PHC86_08435 [Eubacteriales bacterium]|nr:hypothetical protein [Eubacteriales bacterium]
MNTLSACRRGSVSLLVLYTGLLLFLILPYGAGLLNAQNNMRLILRAGAYIDETLPSAYLGLDAAALAIGQFQLDSQQVENMVSERLMAHLPPELINRFEIRAVQVDWQAVTTDPEHFLGDEQPLRVPTVTCVANIHLPNGNTNTISRTIILYQRPN